MADGNAALDAMIASIRKLAGLPEAAAKEAAPLVQKAVQATAAAGTDPYGKAWPTKKDGGRALPDAAANVKAEAHGPVVQISTQGAYAIQNKLTTHRRQLIPDAGAPLPPSIVDALTEGANAAFRKAMC